MKYLFLYIVAVNITALLLYGIDKSKAVRHKWRIPEHTLIGVAMIGGSIGALIGMLMFHHKTRKPKFKFGVPVILIFQLIVVIAVINFGF